jgi:acyl carrier protein
MTEQETKDKIMAVLREAIIEDFGVPAEKVTPAALIYEDLKLDSIDAVDLLVKLKSHLPRPIKPDVFNSVKTLQDVADAVYGAMQDPEA